MFHDAPAPEAVAVKYFVVSPNVTVCELAENVVSFPNTASTVGLPCVTEPLLKTNVVSSPNTTSLALPVKVTFDSLPENVVLVPKTFAEVVVTSNNSKSPNSLHLFPSKMNSLLPYIAIFPFTTGMFVPSTFIVDVVHSSYNGVVVIPR